MEKEEKNGYTLLKTEDGDVRCAGSIISTGERKAAGRYLRKAKITGTVPIIDSNCMVVAGFSEKSETLYIPEQAVILDIENLERLIIDTECKTITGGRGLRVLTNYRNEQRWIYGRTFKPESRAMFNMITDTAGLETSVGFWKYIKIHPYKGITDADMLHAGLTEIVSLADVEFSWQQSDRVLDMIEEDVHIWMSGYVKKNTLFIRETAELNKGIIYVSREERESTAERISEAFGEKVKPDYESRCYRRSGLKAKHDILKKAGIRESVYIEKEYNAYLRLDAADTIKLGHVYDKVLKERERLKTSIRHLGRYNIEAGRLYDEGDAVITIDAAECDGKLYAGSIHGAEKVRMLQMIHVSSLLPYTKNRYNLPEWLNKLVNMAAGSEKVYAELGFLGENSE